MLTSWGRLFHWMGLAAFVLLVFGPLLFPGMELVRTLFQGEWSAAVSSLISGRRLRLLSNSVLFSACVAAGATFLGIAIGSALWRLRSRTGIFLRWFSVLLFIIPPYIHAMAWMSLAPALGFSGLLPSGWIAAWWVEVMALSPLSTGMTLLGLESITPSLIEAARLMRPEKDLLGAVFLPLARPLILAGTGFIFLLSLADYTVPSLFQVNTYALEIFAEYSASSDIATAFLFSIPLVGIGVAALVLAQSRLRRAALQPPRQVKPWPVAPAVTGWLGWVRLPAFGLLAAQVLGPLTGLMLALGSGDAFVNAIRAGRGEAGFTGRIGLVAAVLCLPPALAVARKLAGNARASRAWWLLATAPLALPAPLVGIGLIGLWNRELTHGVYGSGLMPVLACLARFTPLAAVVLCAQLRRIDPLLLDAARVFHVNPVRTWLAIYLPMIGPGVLAAASVTFVLSAGELGATLLVVPPGQSTLTLRIYNYLHYGASERVAGLCLVMVLGALFAGMLAATGLRGGRRMGSMTPGAERSQP